MDIKECIVLNFRLVTNFSAAYSHDKIFFQSVVAPNGLIAHLFGPIEGKRHDAFMLAEIGLSSKLLPLTQVNGQPYVIYGDPAYGVCRNIFAPFRAAQLSAAQTDFSKSMTGVRVSVE